MNKMIFMMNNQVVSILLFTIFLCARPLLADKSIETYSKTPPSSILIPQRVSKCFMCSCPVCSPYKDQQVIMSKQEPKSHRLTEHSKEKEALMERAVQIGFLTKGDNTGEYKVLWVNLLRSINSLGWIDATSFLEDEEDLAGIMECLLIGLISPKIKSRIQPGKIVSITCEEGQEPIKMEVIHYYKMISSIVLDHLDVFDRMPKTRQRAVLECMFLYYAGQFSYAYSAFEERLDLIVQLAHYIEQKVNKGELSLSQRKKQALEEAWHELQVTRETVRETNKNERKKEGDPDPVNEEWLNKQLNALAFVTR